MQAGRLNILKFVFFLGVGILLIWLATKNLTPSDKDNIQQAFEQADYFWITISLLLSILSHVSRALRWKLLLQPLGFNPKTTNTFFAVMVGYLANFALPRLGEVSRCGVLTKYENIPFTEGFGTVVAERVIDLLCLFIIFLITLLFQFDQLWALSNQNIITPLTNKITLLIKEPLHVSFILVLVVATIYLLIKFKKKIANNSFAEKISSLIKGFADGLQSVRKIKRPFLFILHTVIIWFLYTSSLYLGFLCFKETSHLSADAVFAVLIFSTIGVIFVPGGTGASQALVTETLTSVFRVSFTYAFAFAWLLWTSQFILILILGILSLILLPLLNKPKNNLAQ